MTPLAQTARAVDRNGKMGEGSQSSRKDTRDKEETHQRKQGYTQRGSQEQERVSRGHRQQGFQEANKDSNRYGNQTRDGAVSRGFGEQIWGSWQERSFREKSQAGEMGLAAGPRFTEWEQHKKKRWGSYKGLRLRL